MQNIEDALMEDNPLLTEVEDMVENALIGTGKGYFIMIVDRKSQLTSIACNMNKRLVIDKLYGVADNLAREGNGN